MDPKIEGWLNIAVAVIIIAISLPLLLRKVRMNYFYGARFSLSFKSEQNWYDINAAAGKALILWSVPIILYGIIGITMPDREGITYSIGGAVVVSICVIAASVQSYIVARKIDRKNFGLPRKL